MTTAQELDRRITLQADGVEIGRDAVNEPIYGDPVNLTVWASRRDVSDGERAAAGQVGATLQSRFVVRSSTATRAVTPIYRLIHEGATWNISGVKETQDGRRRFIEITATKDAD
ncbi:phage head closure protein [Georhizobium sp. MAB10]|uniref:phage head closure protein n=1 Tax=Georhizobium sp. MAB10 TaxID=3028319 RepID=UPI00385567C5